MTVYLKPILLFILFLTGVATQLSAVETCVAEKAEFKRLYIALQQSLNYEGKDAVLEKGVLVLKAHSKDAAYEGKVFEDALYKEYQRSLRKVGALYQAAKFEQHDKSNPELIKFIKAIDGQDSEVAEYIKNNKVDAVIDQLQAASKKKYDAKHPALITDNDKYLLKKLLTHAQDRVCSVDKFEKTEQQTGKQVKTKHFSADELNRLRNAPLNRLINSIKSGKIAADSDLKIDELKDSDKAINLAIAKNIAALKDWKAKNEKCLKSIANPAFIQSGIQSCNYTRFVQTLDQSNENNLESILHFINSNEKFLNNPAAKAETSMDELKLEAAIDSAFNGLGKKQSCPVVKTKDDKIFVTNLKYDEEKKSFNYSPLEIRCSNGKTVIDDKTCEKSLEFVSDRLGEGMEIRSRLKTPGFKLSVKARGDCQGEAISLTPEKTDVSCKLEGQAQTPKTDLILSADKKSCVAKPAVPPVSLAQAPEKTAAMCTEEGKAANKSLIPSADKKTCIEKPADIKTEAMCTDEGIAAKKTLVPSEDKKSCVEKPADIKTQAQCDDNGIRDNKKYTLSEDKKSCVEKKDEEKTQVQCDEQGKKDSKTYTLSEDKKSCVEKKDGEKTQVQCDEQGKKDSKTYTLSEDKKSCVEKKEEAKPKLSGAEKCEEQNTKWIEAAEEGEVRTDRYTWDEKAKSCKDKQSKASEKDDEESDSRPAKVYAPTTAPPRFQPVNIPTRQMYILPGMP